MSELILRAAETERGSLKLIGIRVLCPPDQYLAEIPRAINLFTERLTEIKGAVIQTGLLVLLKWRKTLLKKTAIGLALR